MDIQNLIQMANRIGDFFQAMPDPTEAKAGIITHIKKFWEPRMRRELLAYIDEGKKGELSDLVLQAIIEGRDQIKPRH